MAREYGIPLEHIEVEVTHKQNRIVNGPNDPRQREMKIVLIRRNIKVKGPITEEQKERLLWGAQHCPLSNTLEGGPRLIDSIEVMG